MDYQRLLHADLRVMADTAVAIPLLTRLCKRKIAASEKLAPQIRKRIAAIGKRHDALRAKWTVQAQLDRDASPITLPRLASEVWQGNRPEDWALTARSLWDWTRKWCGVD